MRSTTIRLKESTRQVLRELARLDGISMQRVLDRAIDDLRRKRFLEEVNQGYAALRADVTASAAEDAESEVWDATLLDGLTSHDPWDALEPGATKRRPRKRS